MAGGKVFCFPVLVCLIGRLLQCKQLHQCPAPGVASNIQQPADPPGTTPWAAVSAECPHLLQLLQHPAPAVHVASPARMPLRHSRFLQPQDPAVRGSSCTLLRWFCRGVHLARHLPMKNFPWHLRRQISARCTGMTLQ